MHRVELKGILWVSTEDVFIKFLMHRVELKETKEITDILHRYVPNAPCGVESFHVE